MFYWNFSQNLVLFVKRSPFLYTSETNSCFLDFGRKTETIDSLNRPKQLYNSFFEQNF